EKVSGSRIATPFAPPRPGSTPMITPRMMPTNISATFFRLSATTKPCSSDWISSMMRVHGLVQPQKALDDAFRQRHLEPDLEDEEEHHAVADADRGDLPPRVLAQPAHEEGDEQHRSDVDAEPADQADVDRRGDEHGKHQLELLDADEG